MTNYSSQRTDREVLEAIKTFIEQRDSGGASAREVGEHIGCSRLTARRAISRLEQAGKIVILPVKGKPNKYEVVSE